MRSNGNYPPGAQYDPAAPWNEKTETKKVTVSVTYSKDFVVEVPEGCTPEELTELVRRSIVLPKEVMDGIDARNKGYTTAYGGWEEDDFAVAE